MGIGVDAPDPPSLAAQLKQVHKSMLKYAPEDYAMESKYGPLYNRLDLNKAQETQRGYTDEKGVYHPGTLQLSSEAASAKRAADVGDVEKLGGRTTDAILKANPYLKSALTRLNSTIQGGPSPILKTLNQQAQEELNQNGQLTQQEIDAEAQQSRQGFAERGTVMGNQSLGAELLSRDAAVRARRQLAQRLGLEVQQANQADTGQVMQAAQVESSVLSDPFMAVLGRPSNVQPQASVPGGGQIYSPLNYNQLLPLESNIADVGYAGKLNAAVAQSNNIAGIYSSLISSIGEVAGAATKASDRRLKENIVEVGMSPQGHRIYEFNYIGWPDGNRLRGVMADEVKKIQPDAVTNVDGYDWVDYGKIDVKMEEVEKCHTGAQ